MQVNVCETHFTDLKCLPMQATLMCVFVFACTVSVLFFPPTLNVENNTNAGKA